MRFDAHRNAPTAFNQLNHKHWIDIRLGLEAEYDPKFMDWMLDLCIQYDVDYLILGCHNIRGMENGIYSGSITKDELQEYVDTCIEGLKTGLYAYLAHPEIFMRTRSLSLDEDVEDAFEQIAKACPKWIFLLNTTARE